MFLPETFRGLRPRTPTYFSLVGKVGKSTHREGTLSMGPSPMYPTPTTTNEGAAAPSLDSPPDSPMDCPGTPQNFTCAGGMNPPLRQGFRRWRKRLNAGLPAGNPCEALPPSNRETGGYAGVSKGGRAPPFVSSRKRGSRGRNPIERVSPPVRFFGHFLSAQKVTRGSGAELPRGFGKKHISFPPARRYTNLSPSARCAGTAPSKK